MRLVSSLVCACIALSVGIAGHTPQVRNAEYRELVAAYRRADREAIARTLAIPSTDLQSFVDAAVGGRSSPAFTWQELRAAAILHSEAWQQQFRTSGADAAAAQLDAAFRLLEAVNRAQPSQWTFVERWRAVIAGILLRAGDERGHRAFRDRVQALLPLSKSQQAAMAAVSRGVEAEAQGNAAGQPQPGRRASARQIQEQQTNGWSRAATEYEAALSLEPGYRLASLRLGRMRVLQGRFDDALAPLEAARDDSDPRVSYLALLYLGSLSERNRRFDDAERVYRDALRRYPRGQSAPLALANLLTRAGREAEALPFVKAMLGDERRVEPLWTLAIRPMQDVRDYAQALAELVAEVEESVE